MRQDKDRGSKWLFEHHGNAILALGGLHGFQSWRAVQSEVVAPRRLFDGLLEVRYPGRDEPDLVLVEIETYPDRDADRQVFEDLLLVALERRALPEVLCLVLRPRGQVEVTGRAERASRQGTARLAGSWRTVRLWDLRAEDLLAAGDVGLVPWVPLTQSEEAPEVLVGRCRERIRQVADPSDRAGLLAVAQILTALAYPGNVNLVELLGGRQAMIESPYLEEAIKEGVAQQLPKAMAPELRRFITDVLATRFGDIPADRLAGLAAVSDKARLEQLNRLAAACPSLEAFLGQLPGPNP